MTERAEYIQQDTVAGLSSVCHGFFQQLLRAIHQSHPPPSQRFDLPKLSEEYGRLNIWQEQTQAAPRSLGRESIEDLLQHDTELLDLVMGTLKRLKSLLDQMISLVQSDDVDFNESSSSSEDAFSDRSSASDMGMKASPGKKLRSDRIIQLIFDQIASLYDFSSLLRRPGIGEQPITYPGGTTSNPPDAAVDDADARYVSEQIEQWRMLSRASKEARMNAETDAHFGLPSPLREDEIQGVAPWLSRRLARANQRFPQHRYICS